MGTPTSSSRPVAAINWQSLEALVSSAILRPGITSDAIGGVIPERVVTPSDEQQISSILRWANENDVRVTISGGGTKEEWTARPEAVDLLISTAQLNGMIEHAHGDMTATVQAGLTVARFQSELAKHSQRIALDVLWPERATIGGIIASNDSGALRLRFGSIRDLLIGITVVLADGTVARSGGKVVKNVAGYDLPKLFTGSLGTLGVITEATFRVHPHPHGTETLTFRFPTESAADKFILAVNDSSLVPVSVQMRCSNDQPIEVDVCFEGLAAGIASQASRVLQLATEGQQIQSSNACWSARQDLWAADPSNIICKFSVLPCNIAMFAEALRARSAQFRMVAQATGLGHFVANCSPENVSSLRTALNSIGGSIVILRRPPGLTSDSDIFGALPDSHPLMIRIKQRFDPCGILNRGRFLEAFSGRTRTY